MPVATPISADTPDPELVQRAQGGELAAFEALTARYEQRVFSLARRILQQEQDAEDVTQQTFLSALENLPGFRGEASFATWLFRIATHAALKIIRKRKGRETVSLEAATDGGDEADAVPHPEFIADRLVFLLRDVEGLSIQETAEALGLSEANVKVRLLRARLQLREQLTRTLGDPAKRLIRPHDHAH